MGKVTSMNQEGKSKPQWDPAKQYRWEPGDVFELTGLQFAGIYHALAREINEPTGCNIAQKMEAYNIVMDILKKGIEQEVIIEQGVAISTDQAKGELDELNLFDHNKPSGNGKEV